MINHSPKAVKLDNELGHKNSFLQESLAFDEASYAHHPKMAEEESVNIRIVLNDGPGLACKIANILD